MKVIKYGDLMKVVCPVCKKTLLEDKENKGDYIHPCKHLKLWHNGVEGNICFTHRSFRSAQDSDDIEFRKIAKKHKMIVHKYKGDYIGGCQYPVDMIAFQQE